jgi:hypothetical protein
MAQGEISYVNQELSSSLVQGRGGLAVLALIALAVMAAALIYGQSARAVADRNKAAASEEENRTFCAGLGLAPASEVYTRCTNGLIEFGRRHEERLSADLGIL